eukprot:268835-Amphidinium_carterae.1
MSRDTVVYLARARTVAAVGGYVQLGWRWSFSLRFSESDEDTPLTATQLTISTVYSLTSPPTCSPGHSSKNTAVLGTSSV